jgi:DNA-binding response OmpR family regulator
VFRKGLGRPTRPGAAYAVHVLDTSPRILIVDDDPNVADVVTRYLHREGFVVDAVSDGRAALDRALAAPPDLVVLDLMLPGIDGLEVCRRIRALAPVPVIMLTARGDEADRVVGLELGADDYMAKPFSPRELTARVKAVLRRARGPLATASGPGPMVLTDAGLVVDVAARQARIDGELVALTARELELLVFLMRRPRQAFGREELLQQVWGYSYGDTSTVTVHVRRLREKVELDPSSPRRIVTVWGVGYRWEGVGGAPAAGGRNGGTGAEGPEGGA